MKKLTGSIFILLFATLSMQSANAQFVKAGVGLMYGTEIEQPGIRVDAVYQINEEFRAVADLGFFFPDKNDYGNGNSSTLTWWELNVNGNYIFYTNEENNFLAYGLAGINYLHVNLDSEGQFVSSYSDSEVGLNIGAGAEYPLDFADLFGELKYVLGDADQLNIGAGLRFNF